MRTLLLSVPVLLAAPALAGPAGVLDQVDELIKRGRTFLDASKPAEALVLFEQADAETRGTLKTRMWVLRAWMDQGRINDAFDHLESEFTEKGAEGPDVDYLFGMGSHRRAKAMVAENVASSTTTFAFNDATSFLKTATAADPEKYYDAFLPLAESAWFAQENETAAAAIEQAVERLPKDVEARFLKGRILMSSFVVANADEARAEEAKELLASAIEAFEAAAELVPAPKEDAARVAAIHKQLADAHLWAAETGEAAKAFATAMGWDPNAVDYGTLFNQLSNEEGCAPFVACLTDGAKQFEEHWGEKTNRDATLQWWLGYGHFASEQYEAAEEAFTKAVAKWPSYTNAWFYTGLARYYRKDYEGMVDAFQKNWEVDPANLVGSIQSNQELHLDIVDYVIGQCEQKAVEENDWSNKVPAAFLCEVRVGVVPENWEYLDNLGLFARDAGVYLRSTENEEDAERAQHYFERAWEAYGKAMELAPEKPHLKNDAAVVLHYYLERDYDEAKRLYEAARDQAEKVLAAGGLDEFEQQLAETALRDSKDNLAKLMKKLEKGG